METRTSPERYTRIEITKNTKGYSYETSVSLTWTDDSDRVADLDALLRNADSLARLEIGRREELDNWKADAEADLEGIS